MHSIVRLAVRTKFNFSRRATINRKIDRLKSLYVDQISAIPPDMGGKHVRVPALPGVDADMRDWSLYQILEHNVIVNRSITAITVALAHDEEPSCPGSINPKTDVMPSLAPGPEQLDAHSESIDAHLQAVSTLAKLTGTRTKKHPLFGDFDAHKWHCMFGFHLGLHLRQARAVIKRLHP